MSSKTSKYLRRNWQIQRKQSIRGLNGTTKERCQKKLRQMYLLGSKTLKGLDCLYRFDYSRKVWIFESLGDIGLLSAGLVSHWLFSI